MAENYSAPFNRSKPYFIGSVIEIRLFPCVGVIFPTLLLILFLIFPEFSNATLSDSDMKKSQIKQIETDLSREREQFLKFDSKEKELLEQLSGIEKDIGEKRGVLKELRENIRLNRDELKLREKRLSSLESSLIKKGELLGKRLVAFYKYGKRGYLRVLTSTSGLDQLNQRTKYLGVIVGEDLIDCCLSRGILEKR